MSKISQVLPPSSLKKTLKFNEKKQYIISHLEELLNYVGKSKLIKDNILIERTRMTLEMTEFVCNLIENVLPKNNKYDINKKDLALEILTDIYCLTVEEKDVIDKQIQYIYDSKLIVRIPVLQKLSSIAVNFFLNFLGLIGLKNGM